MVLNRLQQTNKPTTLVYTIKAETGWQSIVLFDLNWERVCRMFAVLCVMNDNKNATHTHFEVRNKFKQVGEFVKIQSMKNED